MTPEKARAKEAEIHESFPGLPDRKWSDEPRLTPEDDGRTIYRELCKVGDFWRTVDHRYVYYVRYVDGASYRVGSSPRLRFVRFVAALLRLRPRAKRTRDAVDNLTQRMEDQADVGWLHLPIVTHNGEPWRTPLRFVTRKKLHRRAFAKTGRR